MTFRSCGGSRDRPASSQKPSTDGPGSSAWASLGTSSSGSGSFLAHRLKATLRVSVSSQAAALPRPGSNRRAFCQTRTKASWAQSSALLRVIERQIRSTAALYRWRSSSKARSLPSATALRSSASLAASAAADARSASVLRDCGLTRGGTADTGRLDARPAGAIRERREGRGPGAPPPGGGGGGGGGGVADGL